MLRKIKLRKNTWQELTQLLLSLRHKKLFSKSHHAFSSESSVVKMRYRPKDVLLVSCLLATMELRSSGKMNTCPQFVFKLGIAICRKNKQFPFAPLNANGVTSLTWIKLRSLVIVSYPLRNLFLAWLTNKQLVSTSKSQRFKSLQVDRGFMSHNN